MRGAQRDRACACALALTIGLASAASATPRRDVSFGIEATSDFPVILGGSLWLELPRRFRMRTTFGYLPPSYATATNHVLMSAGAYSDSVGAVINAGLRTTLVWRMHLGWRPFPRRGAYFELGYGLLAIGGGLSMAQAVAAVTGAMPPDSIGNEPGYHLSSILHMADVDLGWQWVVAHGLSFRLSLGCALTFASQTHISRNFKPSDEELYTHFERLATDYLDTTYQHYVFTPTVGFAVGWRFFPLLQDGWRRR